jgi:hypothetical protein
MATVINLRGTSGSGKSWVVHSLLKKYPHEVVSTFGPRARPLVYRIRTPNKYIIVPGPYDTPCGGCDAISNYVEVLPPFMHQCADSLRPEDVILFEGLLISTGYGVMGVTLSELREKGHRTVFALLDTPLSVCLERIKTRRAARGVTKPLDPENTEFKWTTARKLHDTIQDRYGHECVLVPYRSSFQFMLRLMGVVK